MKFATRFRVTATIPANSTATSLTLSSVAPLGMRTLAQVITDGTNDVTAYKVNDSGIPLMIDDSAGNWKESYFKLTSNNTIVEESIISSSNGGAAVTFPGTSVNVYSSPPGAWLRQLLSLSDGVSMTALTNAVPSGATQNAWISPWVDPATGNGYNMKYADIKADIVAAAVAAMGSAPVAPGQVTSLTAGASTDTTQVLNWTAPSTGTAPFTYKVEFSTDNSTWNVFNASVSGLTSTVGGLTASKQYYYRVSAMNSAGTGAVSTTLTASTTATPATAPGQVTALTLGTATDTAQPLSWTAPSTGTTPFTYKVEFSPDNSAWSTFAASVSGTSTTVTGLTSSKLYYYRVSAVNSAGTGTASTTASGSTTAAPAVAPGQVTGLTAGTPTDTTQPLSWTALSGATSYLVEKSISGANSWSTAASGVTATSYIVTGLTQSTAYDYRVTGVNSAGNGTASVVVTKSTVATAAVQSIGVNTPATATAYRSYTLTGTYTNGQPAALEYQTTDNGGASSAWATVPSPVFTDNGAGTNSGTWSATITPTTYAASRVMGVRVTAAPTITNVSNAYTVLSMAQAYKITNTNGASMAESTTTASASSPDWAGSPANSIRVNLRDAGGVSISASTHAKIVFGLYNDANCPATFNGGFPANANGCTNSSSHTNAIAVCSALPSWTPGGATNQSNYGTFQTATSMNIWFGTGNQAVSGTVTSGALIAFKAFVMFIDGSIGVHDNATGTPLKYQLTVP